MPANDVLRILRDREAGCYLARYDRGPSRGRVLDLFSTDTLPLPWTSSAPPEAVLDDVRRLNPGAEVLGP